MPRSIRLAFATGLCSGLLALAGCSEPAPPTIDGQTPADYREEMDKKISRPLGDPPAKSPATKGPRRR